MMSSSAPAVRAPFPPQLVFYGDLVITLCWVSCAPQANHWTHRPHASYRNQQRLAPPTEHLQLCEEDEVAQILVLNYPSNPTGLSFDAAGSDIATIARKHQPVSSVTKSARSITRIRTFPWRVSIRRAPSSVRAEQVVRGGWLAIGTFFFHHRCAGSSIRGPAHGDLHQRLRPDQHASVAAFEADQIESLHAHRVLRPWALGALRPFAKQVSA